MLICKAGCGTGWFTPFRLGSNDGETFSINAFSKSFAGLTNRLIHKVGSHAMIRVQVSDEIELRQALAIADKLTVMPIASHWHQLWFRKKDVCFHQKVMEHMYKNRRDLELVLHPPP